MQLRSQIALLKAEIANMRSLAVGAPTVDEAAAPEAFAHEADAPQAPAEAQPLA